MFSKNVFMNCLKRLLVRREIKKRVEVLKIVKTLLLPILNFFARFWPVSSSYFSEKLAQRLIQNFCSIWDPRTIAKEKMQRQFKYIIFLNGFINLLSIEFLEL